MIVFEIVLNGEVVARAGADDLSVLSHTVTARGVLGGASGGTNNVRDGAILETSLTGLTSRGTDDPHVHKVWHNRNLHLGDEVTVRIVDDSVADEPTTLKPREA